MNEPKYYVSVIEGPRRALLAGPYATHQEALDKVDQARDMACKADPWAWFYAFGTCKLKSPESIKAVFGKL